MSKRYDKVTYGLTIASTLFTVISLLAILIFTFTNGFGLLSWDLIKGDYNTQTFAITEVNNNGYSVIKEEKENEYYIENWGITLKEAKNQNGEDVILIFDVNSDSPLVSENYSVTKIENTFISGFIRTDKGASYVVDGIDGLVSNLENSTQIKTFNFITEGGGIRGSLITTILLIVLTLLIVIPVGIFASIYLYEYAKNSKVAKVLQSMIDMLSGVPSIIFGLMGAAIFIPFVNGLTGNKSSAGSILAGALTMSVILLPIIIKTTIEGLKTVSQDLRSASLALGASYTQTTFKVVLPKALGSIITGVILSIGRIVGESAALIFVLGTYISDTVSITGQSTSLAVQIWSIMSHETPNFELASTIALIILTFVLILNLSIKLFYNRKQVKQNLKKIVDKITKKKGEMKNV